MTFLISWTVNLIGIQATRCGCRLYTEIKFSVDRALPATCTAVFLTRDIEAAVNLFWLLFIAGFWTDTAIHFLEPTAIIFWFNRRVSCFQCCFGIHAFELKWKT